jgi:hypothetical protein
MRNLTHNAKRATLSSLLVLFPGPVLHDAFVSRRDLGSGFRLRSDARVIFANVPSITFDLAPRSIL